MRPGPANRPNRPLIIAHRAVSPGFPENSIAAIVHAAAAGADLVELDVHRSLEGVPFLIHDPLLGRVTTGYGPIRLFPAALLRRARVRQNREPLPTLAAALDALPPELGVGLHLKTLGALRAVLRLVEERNLAQRTWLWLPRARAARYVVAHAPAIRVTLLNDYARRASTRQRYFRRAAAVGATAVSIDWSVVGAGVIAAAHAHGLQVFSVNRNPALIPAAIQAGLDGIITADPAAARAAVERALASGTGEIVAREPGGEIAADAGE